MSHTPWASNAVPEHHPWVIGGADPVIELGPDGGDGGVVVAEGTPKQVSRAKTATAPILRELLRTWPGG